MKAIALVTLACLAPIWLASCGTTVKTVVVTVTPTPSPAFSESTPPDTTTSVDTSSGFTDDLQNVGWNAYKKACRHITFPVLNKDAGNTLVGKHFRIKGQVLQIQDAGAGQYLEGYPDGLQPQTMMLLDMTSDGYGYWSDSIAVVYSGALKKVYEKNVVTVYGVCDGQYSYTSVAGYDMTVPLIVARYVTKN